MRNTSGNRLNVRGIFDGLLSFIGYSIDERA